MILRAWDAVLGVLALCTDAPAADDYLPAMAYALLRARPPRLATCITTALNFSARESYEDMWLFHAAAAVGLIAELGPTNSPDETDTDG